MPGVGVAKKSDKYYIHDKEQYRDDIPDDLRRPGDSAREVRWSLSTDNYSCEGHARSGVLPDEIAANSDPAIQAEIRTTELATQKVLLRQELNARTILQDTAVTFATAEGANPPGTTAGANRKDYSGSKWYTDGTTETVDPSEQADLIKAAMVKNCGYAANTVLMSRNVASRIKHGKLVKERFKYSQNAIGPRLTDQGYADLFGVDNVIITDSVLNTGDFGAAATMGWLLDPNVWFIYVPPNPGLNVVAFCYTFLWTAAGGQNGTIVERERAVGGRRSTLFTVHKYYDLKVIDKFAAYMAQTVI